jgi:hypothetical protein
LWDGGQPCSGGSDDAFLSYYTLQRINHRLLTALIEFKTEYISSDWRGIGLCRYSEGKEPVLDHNPFQIGNKKSKTSEASKEKF